MIAATAFIIFVLCSVTLAQAWTIHQLRESASRGALASRTDDIDVLAALEAHAVTSPLAQKLLAAAKTADPEAEKPSVTEKPIAQVKPALNRWGLFVDDWNLETTVEDKIRVLRHWIGRGVRFNEAEQVSICASPSLDRAARQEVREILTTSCKKIVGYMYHVDLGSNRCKFLLGVSQFDDANDAKAHVQKLADAEVAHALSLGVREAKAQVLVTGMKEEA